MQAMVSATATTSSSGTAIAIGARDRPRAAPDDDRRQDAERRSAHTVCDPGRSQPRRGADAGAADAAITLLSAIHAKFDHVQERRRRAPAPAMPSAGRAAITEGTRRREPSGASAATSAAPATLPTTINSSRRTRRLNDDARLAPTWNVVATTLAPTKIRNRSSARLRLRVGANRGDVCGVHGAYEYILTRGS